MSGSGRLIAANIRVLDETARLIAHLDDAWYRRAIGPQVRHCLDFYGCLLGGLASGRIDYEARTRESALESSRSVARDRLREVAARLAALDLGAAAAPLAVRAEAEADDGDLATWSPSSLRRELEFLLSHTVHHQALIAQMARARGVEPGPSFGVAPSTLRHRGALALAS